jgi:type III secretion system low calcium response chaperone LcrH/SycD
MELTEIIEIIIKQVQKLANCSAADKEKVQKILIEMFQSESTPAKTMKYPKDQLELMYSYCVSLYEGGKYKDAQNGFYQIFAIDPQDPRFSFGLAASYHKLKEYQKAIEYYLIVGKLDKSDPKPWAHAADCYINLGNLDVACVMLAKAVQISGDRPEYNALKRQSELIRQTLQKQIRGSDQEQTSSVDKANV